MPVARSVKKLEAYTPGEQPKSRRVIKLNTNENPYPPSPACARALSGFPLDRLRRYPDPVFRELRRAIAGINGAKPECVFVGNGSDEVLTVAARTFVEDDGVIGSLDPSYSLYKTLAAIRNVAWRGIDIRDLRSLERSEVEGTALFLLTNPNAPTGVMKSVAEISAFARKAKGVVIVDEAYADFAADNCMRLATSDANRNVIVMRTFSKSYSLAGLRVGYCIGPEKLIEAMYKVKDSYNVDALAQAIALAAVKDQRWMKSNVAKIVSTRKRFTAELEKLGWDVLPSETNFVFARPPSGNAEELFRHLKEENIFVRYFPGRKTGERLRITIGTDPEMKKLLTNLKRLSR